MTSWVSGAAGSGYDVDHLPYGVFSPEPGAPNGSTRDDAGRAAEPRHIGVRIGDQVLDLTSLARLEKTSWESLLGAGLLNPLLAAGPAVWQQIRTFTARAVSDPGSAAVVEPHLHALSKVVLHRPFDVADFVDFYASEHHAAAVGRIFRPDASELPAAWKYLPIGYHGRAGTVVPSGTPIVRPCGQRKSSDNQGPAFGPTRQLDIEAEVGFVVGVGSELSYPVPAAAFADHVFGVCVVNDWSARDIQAWEYVPLGPFLGKSFATSTSHWITPLAALQSARVPPPARSQPLLDYLADDPDQPWGLDIDLAVTVNGTLLSRPPYATMYYTGPQFLAQLTANGASIRTGDLFASGTVSGPRADEAGSLLELSMGGRREIQLVDGSTRTFLQDGDTVSITATAPSTGGGRVELGEVAGTVRPARP